MIGEKIRRLAKLKISEIQISEFAQKSRFTGTQSYSLVTYCAGHYVTETAWAQKPKIFALWPLVQKVCRSWPKESPVLKTARSARSLPHNTTCQGPTSHTDCNPQSILVICKFYICEFVCLSKCLCNPAFMNILRAAKKLWATQCPRCQLRWNQVRLLLVSASDCK